MARGLASHALQSLCPPLSVLNSSVRPYGMTSRSGHCDGPASRRPAGPGDTQRCTCVVRSFGALGGYLCCHARVPASEIVLATTIHTANEDQRPGVVAVAGFVAQHGSVVVVMARGGHEAKRVTGAWLLTEIVSRSVN